MEDKKAQEKSIRKHLVKLIKLTRNLEDLLGKLVAYEVLDEEEVQQIKLCSDDETSCHMLYELSITKLPVCFDLLMFALRDTDNDRLAQLIEDSSKYGDEHSRRLRRASSTERYSKPETRALSIDGAEMGIVELLEDYPKLSTNGLECFIRLLKLDEQLESLLKCNGGRRENFVFGATQVLREWTRSMGQMANVVKFCALLEAENFHEAAVRVRQMFDNYVDSGFAFDFPGNFTIEGKESKISEILSDNPSFCLSPERLYLLLSLPLYDMNDYIKENNFIKNSNKMLLQWTRDNPDRSSIDHLAAALAFNGHFYTAERVSNL